MTANTQEQRARTCVVGAAETGSSAVLVTLTNPRELLERRTVELVEAGLSSHPHHHEGSWAMGRYLQSPWARVVTLAEALELVERVRACAERRARTQLLELDKLAPGGVARIALRQCQPVPASVEAAIADARVQTYADSVMYRRALASAAEELGWEVVWYERDSVARAAESVLGATPLNTCLSDLGRSAGKPWQALHRLAATAAIAALARPESKRAQSRC
jgi:hypothetical protein